MPERDSYLLEENRAFPERGTEMKIANRQALFVMCSGVCCVAGNLEGEVIEYIDKGEWQGVVGAYMKIDFTGFAECTVITDQYSHLGLLFGGDLIDYDPSGYQDDWGLDGGFGILHPIEIWFAEPVTAIAADFLGDVLIELYSGGELVYTSSYFGYYSKFAGLVSAEPFDAAKILDPSDEAVFIDNLYFAPPIPGPSALGLLGIAFVGIVRRRRG